MKKVIIILFAFMATLTSNAQSKQVLVDKETQEYCSNDSMIVRIAELEIYPEYLTEYLDAATEIGGISVHEESGVICIFPMQMKENPNMIRIIEIYRSPSAYQSHLQTPHFLKYKTGTLHMVKSLRLPEMQPLDMEAMPNIFRKME